MEENQAAVKCSEQSSTYIETPPGELRVSVRQMVEFLLREGDIDNRHQGSSENAMQEGSRIHRVIQKRQGAEYRAEVTLRYTQWTGKYHLILEGRADGVVDQPGQVMIDEIKGTYRDLDRLKRPVPVHIAQAKCYAYMYALEHGHQLIQVRMTYCNIETEDIRYFYQEYTFPQLEEWFLSMLSEYRKWADYTWEWGEKRQSSLEGLEFPFPYREGQKDLVTYVYQTIYHKKKLFLEAPTGVGKTISTIYPALKAMSKRMGDKIFYLTAKTITRTVADETFRLLRDRGLLFKSVILTAKEKICFTGETECNPQACPYAKGHYDRINDAVYDLLTHEDSFSRENIEFYASKHQVCPFEMALDMSLFSDGIICDYNYLFDPHVYLKRFFEGGGGDYLFLIDEAHNLLDRGREMYSAQLVKEDFLKLKRAIHQIVSEERREGRKVNDEEKDPSGAGTGDQLDCQLAFDLSDMSLQVFGQKKPSKSRKKKQGKSILVREGYAERMIYHLENCNKELLLLKRECPEFEVVEEIDGFVNALLRLYNVFMDYFEEQEEVSLPVRDELLDFYFDISHFLDMYERVDDNYVKYTQLGEDGSFLLKLFCVNPKENLKECMNRGRSSILFSATFLPIQYYKELLGGEPEDYEVYAKSVFQKEKRALYIADDVTTKYTCRTETQFYNIACYINEIVSSRAGNYMVFCPSYSLMQRIYEVFDTQFGQEGRECILQQESMNEEQREAFLNRFRGNEDCDMEGLVNMEIEYDTVENTLVGFCVLGGIFGEGIDLKKDCLIGSIIVGTGLPQVCRERDLLKQYFDDRGQAGFDYAYRYPGMNKVLQAAGRVIRTQEDVGVIALLDERFLQNSYLRMFPREWENYEVVHGANLSAKVERFWDSWGKYQ